MGRPPNGELERLRAKAWFRGVEEAEGFLACTAIEKKYTDRARASNKEWRPSGSWRKRRNGTLPTPKTLEEIDRVHANSSRWANGAFWTAITLEAPPRSWLLSIQSKMDSIALFALAESKDVAGAPRSILRDPHLLCSIADRISTFDMLALCFVNLRLMDDPYPEVAHYLWTRTANRIFVRLSQCTPLEPVTYDLLDFLFTHRFTYFYEEFPRRPVCTFGDIHSAIAVATNHTHVFQHLKLIDNSFRDRISVLQAFEDEGGLDAVFDSFNHVSIEGRWNLDSFREAPLVKRILDNITNRRKPMLGFSADTWKLGLSPEGGYWA